MEGEGEGEGGKDGVDEMVDGGGCIARLLGARLPGELLGGVGWLEERVPGNGMQSALGMRGGGAEVIRLRTSFERQRLARHQHDVRASIAPFHPVIPFPPFLLPRGSR